MNEQERGPARRQKKKEGDRRRTPEKPKKAEEAAGGLAKRVEREGKEKKEAVAHEKRKASEIDPDGKTRKELLKKALAEKGAGSKELQDAGANIDKIIEFISRKEEGKEVDEKEKASILELLLALLKYLWNQVKEVLKDEEGEFAELIEAAKASGKNTPEEMAKWMFEAFELSPQDKEGLDSSLREAEQREGLKAEEYMKLRGWETISGGADGGEDVSEMDYEEIVREGRAVVNRVRQLRRSIIPELLDSTNSQEIGLGMRLRESLSEQTRNRISELTQAIVEGDESELGSLRRNLEELRNITDPIENLYPKGEDVGRFLSIYGPKAVNLLNEIEGYKEDGVYRLLVLPDRDISEDKVRDVIKKLEARKGKIDRGSELDKALTNQLIQLKSWIESDEMLQALGDQADSSARAEAVQELKDRLRTEFIKPLFEKIVGDAEDDPREGFRMETWGHILFSELMDRLKDAGPEGIHEKRRWDSFMYARRVFHFLNMEAIKGADIKNMSETAERFLLSEDLDTLTHLEPGLAPARRVVERILKQIRMDPKYGGRIPYEYVISSPHEDRAGGPYKPPLVEQKVREALLEMSKNGVLKDEAGRGIDLEGEEGEREAARLAAMALKVSNVELRTAEHFAQTPLKPGHAYLRSRPFDKIPIDTLRMTGERFEQYGRGREAILPMIRRMNQFIQPGVYEKIPENDFDEWGVNPENFFQYGGIRSASGWRSLTATHEQRERGLALGLEIAFELEEDERVLAWEKVGKRMPTVIARYYPTLSLESTKSGAEFFSYEKRRRKDLGINDTNSLDAYIRWKVDIHEEVYDPEAEVEADIKAGLVKERNKKIEVDEREKQRKKEIEIQEGAKAHLLWIVAEKSGSVRNGRLIIDGERIDPRRATDEQWEKWEGEAWSKWNELHDKLSVYEEYALRTYVEDEDGYGKGDESKYPSVISLVNEDSLGLGFENWEKGEGGVVERLTYLGGKEGQEQTGAERLAKVEFSATPFTEDILYEEERWSEIGPRGISRRYNDGLMFVESDHRFWQIANGLATFEDKVIAQRGDLIKSLAELQHGMVWMSEPDRQKRVAAYTHQIVDRLFKADAWWMQIPLIGPLLDWGGPFGLWKPAFRSSVAQRKFGTQALSMTALERYQFLNDLRPYIGNEQADHLQVLLKARLRNAIFEVFWQYLMVGVPVYVLGKWTQETIKGLGKEMEGVATGQ